MPASGTADEGAAAVPPSRPDDVEPGAFRAVMATVCTPVSVVTAMAGDRPHGSTVSAFASLSLNPPMVLVSLDLSSDLLRHIRDSGAFGCHPTPSPPGRHCPATHGTCGPVQATLTAAGQAWSRSGS
ncbi:MAG: flavin reductase family protein, partial [Trebonia sp.]